jgi:tetratricopeptide (TPR) repeat protein
MREKLLNNPEKKKFFIKKCMAIYGDALAQTAQCFETRAKILSNRALLHMWMKNYRKAIEDALEAVKFDSKLMKPYCRASEALLKLGMYEKCIKLADRGLKVEFLRELKELREEAYTKLTKENEEKQKKAEAKKGESEKLMELCKQSRIVLGQLSDYPLPQVYNVVEVVTIRGS